MRKTLLYYKINDIDQSTHWKWLIQMQNTSPSLKAQIYLIKQPMPKMNVDANGECQII
jgi:hypothetical protein